MNNNFKLFIFILALGTASYFITASPNKIEISDNPRRKRKHKTKKITKRNSQRPGKLVRVYRNINTGTLSVQEKTPQGWRVKMHPHKIKIKNAKFKVNQTGRNKVLKTKQKNVHAMIEGELVDTKGNISGQKIIYDPYKTKHFMKPSGKKVSEAEIVMVDSSGLIKAKGVA